MVTKSRPDDGLPFPSPVGSSDGDGSDADNYVSSEDKEEDESRKGKGKGKGKAKKKRKNKGKEESKKVRTAEEMQLNPADIIRRLQMLKQSVWRKPCTTVDEVFEACWEDDCMARFRSKEWDMKEDSRATFLEYVETGEFKDAWMKMLLSSKAMWEEYDCLESAETGIVELWNGGAKPGLIQKSFPRVDATMKFSAAYARVGGMTAVDGKNYYEEAARKEMSEEEVKKREGGYGGVGMREAGVQARDKEHKDSVARMNSAPKHLYRFQDGTPQPDKNSKTVSEGETFAVLRCSKVFGEDRKKVAAMETLLTMLLGVLGSKQEYHFLKARESDLEFKKGRVEVVNDLVPLSEAAPWVGAGMPSVENKAKLEALLGLSDEGRGLKLKVGEEGRVFLPVLLLPQKQHTVNVGSFCSVGSSIYLRIITKSLDQPRWTIGTQDGGEAEMKEGVSWLPLASGREYYDWIKNVAESFGVGRIWNGSAEVDLDTIAAQLPAISKFVEDFDDRSPRERIRDMFTEDGYTMAYRGLSNIRNIQNIQFSDVGISVQMDSSTSKTFTMPTLSHSSFPSQGEATHVNLKVNAGTMSTGIRFLKDGEAVGCEVSTIDWSPTVMRRTELYRLAFRISRLQQPKVDKSDADRVEESFLLYELKEKMTWEDNHVIEQRIGSLFDGIDLSIMSGGTMSVASRGSRLVLRKQRSVVTASLVHRGAQFNRGTPGMFAWEFKQEGGEVIDQDEKTCKQLVGGGRASMERFLLENYDIIEKMYGIRRWDEPSEPSTRYIRMLYADEARLKVSRGPDS